MNNPSIEDLKPGRDLRSLRYRCKAHGKITTQYGTAFYHEKGDGVPCKSDFFELDGVKHHRDNILKSVWNLRQSHN